jgi:hypothetical protein
MFYTARAQLSIELLIGFTIALSFVLLVSASGQHYLLLISSSKSSISNSIESLSNAIGQASPVIIHAGTK